MVVGVVERGDADPQPSVNAHRVWQRWCIAAGECSRGPSHLYGDGKADQAYGKAC